MEGTNLVRLVAGMAGLALLLFAVDRLALWAERRGWIYYRFRKAAPGSKANAFLEVQTLLEPSKEHIVEVRKEIRQEEAEPGEAPDPLAPPGCAPRRRNAVRAR